MGIPEQLAELEQRVAKLESLENTAVASRSPAGTPSTGGTAFWALEELRDRTTSDPDDTTATDDTTGAVLFTGIVDLPTGEHYEWQQGHPVSDILHRELDQDWTETAASLAALGHPVRLLLLHAILRGTRTAADLTNLDGVGTTGQIYHHLRQLTGTGWLRATARGQYAIPPERIVPLLTVLAAGR